MPLRLKGGGLFAFAGLWTPDPDGQETCAIVTTGANRTMAAIHERMPVILVPGAEAAWLDPDADAPAALACLRPLPDEALEAYPLGPLVSSVRNDGPELTRRLGGDGAQPGLPLG
jgi:putative SOS response-associated peptidase YedK